MYGLENQERIHYAMPMRVMGLDYAAYKKQYDSQAKKNRKHTEIDGDEYLSKMRKTDKLSPVITVVVYYGEKPWDAAVSLHGMLDIPPRLAGLVSDYKMNLVEARKNDLALHNTNNIDLFQLLEIIMNQNLSRQEAREQAIVYADSHKVDKSVIMTVAGATNSRIDYNAFEKGDGRMCTLFEEIAKENENRGRQEGEARQIVEMGQEFGLPKSDILLRLQKKLNVPEEAAQAYMEMYGKKQ
ncbi:MAG: Rpn family recombination-promoting nuclease/putative transposase [Lachnospiraceae bacterium]|nr:Rpn family recombination-promoting nuclease/putative transposase [Lachnospiraceae bacterium]